MMLLKAAKKVVGFARAIREYYASELPKRHPHYPLVRVEDKVVPAPPEEKQLIDFLASLPDEIVYELLLIMYLGRGDFAANELAANYDALKDTFGNAKNAALQMLDKAPLADYLCDGLEELRKNKIDLDQLPLKKPRVRSRS